MSAAGVKTSFREANNGQGGAMLTFWFDFASTYSYLSACRIEQLANNAGVGVTWRPLFLGAIFKGQGWDTSPFNIYPAKGRNMWRDFERRAAVHRVDASQPPNFPQHSLRASRIALVGLQEGWGTDFIRTVFTREFARGGDINDPELLAACVTDAGGSADSAIEAAESIAIKDQLRAHTEQAISAGVFGVPAFQVGEELFWGDDRLEEALLWTVEKHPGQARR